MKITIAKRLQAIIIVSIALTTQSTDLNGRENESFLARPIAWASSILEQFRTTRRKIHTEIPKERLAFQAAHINSAISPLITPEERAILIKNLGYFKQLIANAKDIEDARNIMISILLPEQRGKAQRPFEGVALYTEKFSEEEDKSFFRSDKGKQSLQQLLMHAPSPRQNVSYAQRMQQQEYAASLLLKQLHQKQSLLSNSQKKLEQAQAHPKVIAALKYLENDPIINTHQKKLLELTELLEKKIEDPELQKILPLITSKDEEVAAKVTQLIQNPLVSPEQRQEQANALLAEYELFLEKYPIAKEFFTLQKETVILQQQTQQLVQEKAKKYPEIALYTKLLSIYMNAVEEYNALVTETQKVKLVVEQQISAHNTKIWCLQLDQWFNACIQALLANTQPENHILFHEHEMKAQEAEWHAIIEGHKDLGAYLFYKELNKHNREKFSDDYLETQYARLDKTVADIEQETLGKISQALNLPKNTEVALQALGINDIEEGALAASHRSLIKKQFYEASRATHPDKNSNEANKDTTQRANTTQASINETYTQLTNLLAYAPETNRQVILHKACQEIKEKLENNFSGALSPDQLEEKQQYLEQLKQYQELERTVKEELAYKDRLLQMEYAEAQHNIDIIERPLEHERILERKIRENSAFKRIYSIALLKAQQSHLKATLESPHVDYFARPSTALIVKHHD